MSALDMMLEKPNQMGSIRVSLVARVKVEQDRVKHWYRVLAVMKDKTEVLWQIVGTDDEARREVGHLTMLINQVLMKGGYNA